MKYKSIILLATSLSSQACSHARQQPQECEPLTPTPSLWREVPIRAPDSIPMVFYREIYDEANLTESGVGLIPRNIVILIFHDEATLPQRQLAVDAVNGEVVGGGWGTHYVVRIKDDGTLGPLDRAIDTLKRQAAVKSASADLAVAFPGGEKRIQYRCSRQPANS